MRRLLIATALVEFGAGVAMLCVPSEAVTLLLSFPLEGTAALTMAHITGAALLALAIACWLAHFDSQSRAARAVVTAMTFYNLAVIIVLGDAGIRLQATGVALWPAVGLHAAM